MLKLTYMGIGFIFTTIILQCIGNHAVLREIAHKSWDADNLFIWPVILFTILCLISYSQMTLTRKARLVNQFPQDPKYPLIGTLYKFIFCKPEDILQVLSNYRKKHGPCSAFWFGHKPYIALTSAENIQKILGSKSILEKGTDYEVFKWLMGNGLITSKIETWRGDRKLLNPAFSYKSLSKFLTCFNKHSKILLNVMEEKFEDRNMKSDMLPIITRFTIDSITETALGKCFNVQRNPEAEFVGITRLCIEIFRKKIFNPFLSLPIVRNISGLAKEEALCLKFHKDLFDPMIRNRREFVRTKTDTAESRPLIDLLVENKSDEEVFGHIVTIFGAGFETSANSMNYTMLLLALNPECQKRVHEELDMIFEGDSDRDITLTDLSEMKYLEMCIKESMRLYPPAPAIIRTTNQDIPLDNGKTIPKGCEVTILLPELHRDAQVFPNPEDFNPEHFSSERCTEMSPFAYLPFGYTPRNCIGYKYVMIQMKTVMAHILRRYTVATSTKREDLQLVLGMVLELTSKILLSFEKRI